MKHTIRRRLAGICAVLGVVATAWGAQAGQTQLAQTDFLTDLIMSEEQGRRIAEQEHPKILEQFGGAYDDPELARYVQSIVTYLGRVSRRPDIPYRVTILNTPVVNAFALPAGYLYVTRGLLALAESEAELAGVLGHEIGHVTARHTAQRYSRIIVAAGIVGLLGALTKNTQYAGLTDLATPLALIAIQSFSRKQEYEADVLGVRTVSRAGYDPHALSRFLAKLEAHTALQARLMGRTDSGEQQLDLLATHPRTADRVERTIAEARGYRVYQPMVARDVYLRKIDGMLYGDDPAQGFIRGTVFAHPGLDIRFEVPPDFHMLNGQKQVIAQGPEGTLIRFDLDRIEPGMDLGRYIREVWARDKPFSPPQPIVVNGFRAATAVGQLPVQGQPIDLRLVAIRTGPSTVYRFMYVTRPGLTERFADDFRRTTFSFRRLTEAERRGLRPYRVRIVQVRPGDTVESLARRQPFADYSVERFRTLNGLREGQRLRPYQLVKIVVEE